MSAAFSMLGDVAEFINGAAFKPEDWGDEGPRIIRIQNLNDPTKPYNRTTREVSERLHVHPGDILVSWSASLGVFEWQGPDVGLLNQHIFRVLPNQTKVDKRYLLYALELALLDMQKHLHGATMMHVNRGEFLATRVYLPSLLEQRCIAAILDQADALRAKRREALALLDELKRGIFIEMFGDPVANPRNWAVRSLESVCNKITDGTHKTPIYVDEGVEFISAKDLKNARVKWGSGKFISEKEHAELIKRCNPELGDLLLAKSGSLGAVAVIDRCHEFSLFESLCLIKHDRKKIDGQFLADLLRVPSMQTHLLEKNKGVAIKHLHLVDVRGLKIPTPPVELQREFAARVSMLERQASMYSDGLAGLDSLFASLQDRAFRGEL